MTHAVSTNLAPSPRGFYSQAVHAGPFLFISGQLALDADGNVVGDSVAEQTTRALENVKGILAAANASLADLVQVVVYVSDMADWLEVDTTYAAFLSNVVPPPARTVVPTRNLHYGAKVEIQALAYIDDSQ